MLYSNYFQIALVHLNSEVSRNQNPIATSFFHLIGIKDTDALIGSAVQTSFFFFPATCARSHSAARPEAPTADTNIKDKSKVFVRLVATSFPCLPQGSVCYAAPALSHTTQTFCHF